MFTPICVGCFPITCSSTIQALQSKGVIAVGTASKGTDGWYKAVSGFNSFKFHITATGLLEFPSRRRKRMHAGSHLRNREHQGRVLLTNILRDL